MPAPRKQVHAAQPVGSMLDAIHNKLSAKGKSL
jgi:hypothetical protein